MSLGEEAGQPLQYVLCMPYDWAHHGLKEVPENYTIDVIKLSSNGSHYPICFVDLFHYVYAKTQLVIEYDSKVFFLINYPEWFSTAR